MSHVSYDISSQVEEILQEVEIDSPSVCVTNLINTLFNALQLYESMGVLTEHITKVRRCVLLIGNK